MKGVDLRQFVFFQFCSEEKGTGLPDELKEAFGIDVPQANRLDRPASFDVDVDKEDFLRAAVAFA